MLLKNADIRSTSTGRNEFGYKVGGKLLDYVKDNTSAGQKHNKQRKMTRPKPGKHARLSTDRE